MESVLDVFKADGFSVGALTDAINLVPNKYGRVQQMGMFSPARINTTTVMVEYKNGLIRLVGTQERGAPAPVNKDGKRFIKTFTIPHAPLEDKVTAAEVQDIRAFGSGSRLMGVMEKVNDKLAAMALNHHITWEFWRMGALKGLVLDADGSTILDLFTEFGVTEKVIDFALATETTDVAGKCREVVRHIEDNLLGDVSSGVHCLCGEEFFDALVNHPEVVAAYQAQDGNEVKKKDLRKGFTYQGITFEEYRGQATAPDGSTVYRFVAADEARFFPMGTMGTFRNYVAPADFIEAVNTRGKDLYARIAADPEFNRFVKLHTQSNHLPICHRPAVLVKGTKVSA